MIHYALVCDRGHEFESWFSSSDGYDAQAARGLVTCPVCDTSNVGKRLMAPAIARKDRSLPRKAAEEATASPAPPPEAPQPVALLSEREQHVRAMLRAVRDHVTRTAEHVGPRFVEEARKMHYGEIEHRSIYGEASPEEAKTLIEEGIEIQPLPTVPEERN